MLMLLVFVCVCVSLYISLCVNCISKSWLTKSVLDQLLGVLASIKTQSILVHYLKINMLIRTIPRTFTIHDDISLLDNGFAVMND